MFFYFSRELTDLLSPLAGDLCRSVRLKFKQGLRNT